MMSEEDKLRFEFSGPDNGGGFKEAMAFDKEQLPTFANIKTILTSKCDIEVGSISQWVAGVRRGRKKEHKVKGERAWSQMINDWVDQREGRMRNKMADVIRNITERLVDDTQPDSQVGQVVNGNLSIDGSTLHVVLNHRAGFL